MTKKIETVEILAMNQQTIHPLVKIAEAV